MIVPTRHMLAALALAFLPGVALADPCCAPPPSPPSHCCDTQPSPPPSHGCGDRCGPPRIVVPPPNVPTPNLIVVNAGARASAHASAFAIASSGADAGAEMIIRQNGGLIGGGGGAVAMQSAAFTVTETAFETETHSAERMALIQAICMDERGTPHPASQTFGERDIADGYAGEIYRCMSGTHMRATIEGRSFDCAAGEALWYENGIAACRTQIARRPCNERSLLRRFGPGEKMVRIRETETREARRETEFSAAMTMDGGVGQSVW